MKTDEYLNNEYFKIFQWKLMNEILIDCGLNCIVFWLI